MNLKRQLVKNENDDPFKDMGFIKFWIVSTLFCMAFPVSLFVSYFIIGRAQTKKLVKAITEYEKRLDEKGILKRHFSKPIT